jgi:hypothetical protein
MWGRRRGLRRVSGAVHVGLPSGDREREGWREEAGRWARSGVGPSCKREGERMASRPGCNSNKIQNTSNSFQLGLNQHQSSEFKIFEIKYRFGGFEGMNNFLHGNLIRFEMNFELKFWEVKV